MMGKERGHKKIIISGGGTGGHVFPAIAIADSLRTELGDPEILFVGARGRMEMEKVPEAGYRIVGLPVEGFRRRFSLANLRVILNLITSLNMAARIIREFSPDAVVGVGGYASGPVLRKAAAMGIPTLIQEQNSYAGMTNRLLARKARKICVAYEGMEKYFPADKLVLTGNPVRREILALGRKDGRREDGGLGARASQGIDPGQKVLLVLGGSLGAQSINRAVAGGLGMILESGIAMIWQCGKGYYEEALEALREFPPGRVHLKDFIVHMDQAYLAADLIIARAGAITISELCHVGKPVILVPSPNVAEDHQTRNARALENRAAAICIADREALERLVPEALNLLNDRARMDSLSAGIAGLAVEDPAARIAREVAEMLHE